MLLPYRTAATQLFCIGMRIFFFFKFYHAYTSVCWYSRTITQYNDTKNVFHFVLFFSCFRLNYYWILSALQFSSITKLFILFFSLSLWHFFVWSIPHTILALSRFNVSMSFIFDRLFECHWPLKIYFKMNCPLHYDWSIVLFFE